MRTADHELEQVFDLDRDDGAVQTRSRRSVLAGSAAAIFLAGAGLIADRDVLAKEEDDHDEDDNSGPGGGGDEDHSGEGGDDKQSDDDRHGLPPDRSTQVEGQTTVQIIDERFEPNNILIETGQTITWVNQDDDQHTASGKGMDTGVINPGSEGSVTFLEPGEFPYTCNFHPEMLGLVTVTGESMATPDATPPEALGAAPSTADVAIVDFAFEPEIATIAVGGTITWTNTGQAPHTIFADWADSDIMDPGVTFSWTFEEAGTYDYICGLHPAMTGTIEVVAAAGRATGTPTMGEIQGPGGVWLIGYEFDEPDLLPNQQALVSFEPAGVLQVDLVSESEPQSLTGGHGSWSVNEDGTINSSWFVLFRDTTSGEVLTIRIDDSAEADATGSYAGTIDVEVTTENGSTANLTGTSAGRRLSP